MQNCAIHHHYPKSQTQQITIKPEMWEIMSQFNKLIHGRYRNYPFMNQLNTWIASVTRNINLH
jgi:hypothetical protein